MLLQTIYKYVCIWCPNQPTLSILTTVSTSNPIPTIIKNWNIDGNVILGNLITEQQYIFYILFNITHFSTNCVHCYILSKKKLRKQTIFNINTYFMIRTTYVKFQISTTIISQGNLNSGCEIKQHIWQWRYKEDRSRSAVRCHNLNGNDNNIKWGTIISQKCHYFFTQSHSTLMCLSQLGKVFTIVMAEIRLLNYSCCRIGDLESDVSQAQK